MHLAPGSDMRIEAHRVQLWIGIGVAVGIGLSGKAGASERPVAPGRQGEAALALDWRPLPVEVSGDVVNAVALDSAGRLAVGDDRGVLVGLETGTLRRIPLRGAVRDLAFFAGDGDSPVLLAATESDLYRIDAEGAVESVSTGPGPAARAVERIRVLDGVVAVATGDGAYVSDDGRRWRRLSDALPSGAASAIALRESARRIECWVAIDGELWLSPVASDAVPAGTDLPVRVRIPFATGRRSVNDIALGADSDQVIAVFDSVLVARSQSDGRWEVVRPTLPPGARAARLVAGLDRFWLATSRGLLMAKDLRGPWNRVLAAAGSSPAQDLASGDGALYVGTDEGLWVGRLSRRAEPQPLRSVAPRSAEPDVLSVHRAALRYLDLQPERVAELRRGVARRGWLPILALRATTDHGRGNGSDYDEAWVGGEMRRLRDRDEDRHRDLQLQLTVSWDFGDIAYHPEQIDVSREARELIELRDDVLDEINQLYFERQRVLAELAAQTDPAAARALRPRAAQLAAGIDAWTGGWYSRQLAAPTP